MTPHHRPPRPEEENTVRNETKEIIAEAIRGGLVEQFHDAVNARDWTEDILLTGARRCGGGVGYDNPSEAADNLTGQAVDAVLSALSAAGLVIVPREPSVAMWAAGTEVREERKSTVIDIWRAMVHANAQPLIPAGGESAPSPDDPRAQQQDSLAMIVASSPDHEEERK